MPPPDLILAYFGLWADLLGYRLARNSRVRRGLAERISETRLSIWLIRHRKL